MFVARYRRIALQAPLVGFVVSAGLFQFVVVTGSIGQPWRISVAETVRSILTWGLIGVVVALAALLGGLVAIAIADRGLTKTSMFRVSWAGIGAGVAVFVECVLFGALVNDSGWPLGYTMLGVVAGIIAAITGGALVSRAERRAADAPAAHEVDADRPEVPASGPSA